MVDNNKVSRSGRWGGSADIVRDYWFSAWERPVPVGCSLAGSGNRRGENHDENSTDWRCGRLIAGRGHVCHGSKRSTHGRIPSPLRLPSSPPRLLTAPSRGAVVTTAAGSAVVRLTRWRQLAFPQPTQSHRAAIAAASSTILSGKRHIAIQTVPSWGSAQGSQSRVPCPPPRP